MGNSQGLVEINPMYECFSKKVDANMRKREFSYTDNHPVDSVHTVPATWYNTLESVDGLVAVESAYSPTNTVRM